MFEHIYIYIYHICVFEKETAHIVCSVGVRLMTDVTVLSSYFTYIILKRDNKYVWKIRHELLKHARIAHRLLGTSHSTIRAIPGIRNDIAWLKKKPKWTFILCTQLKTTLSTITEFDSTELYLKSDACFNAYYIH